MCSARWSEREKQRLHTPHWKGFAPVCFLKWRVSSSERANRHSHPSQEHWYGFSPSAKKQNNKKKKQIDTLFNSTEYFLQMTYEWVLMMKKLRWASTVSHKSVCPVFLAALFMRAAGFMWFDSSEMWARSVSRQTASACQVHSSAWQHHTFTPK